MQARRRRIAACRAARTPQPAKANMVLRFVVAFLLIGVLLSAGLAVAAYAYVAKAKLPGLNQAGSSLQFENTQIMASNKKVLYDLPDPKYGNRILKPLELNPTNRKQCPQGRHTHHLKFYYTCAGDGIPLMLRDATIATEDPTFYSNPGFDPLAMARAAVFDFSCFCVVQGGSTITQQFVKQYLLKNNSLTFTRKAKELILAVEMTRKYTKDYILYYYLNSVFYGDLSYGVQAAAQAYFHVGVSRLKLWQAATIAGLPQSPSVFDPFNDPGTGGQWYARMLQVLNYMVERHYISRHQELRAEREATSYASGGHFRQAHSRVLQPKFVNYAIDQFDQMTDPTKPQYDKYLADRLGNLRLFDGLRIITTLNPALQLMAEQTVHNQVVLLEQQQDNVTDGALISIDTRNSCYGCILAMVGTADVDKTTASINMADSPRQPGSSFKVFNYVSAFQKGLSPGSSVYDEPVSIPDASSPTGYYSPTNYDQQFHGLVSVRTALANSFNIPALKVELWNGVGTVARTAHRFGITDLWRDNPGCCKSIDYATTLGGLPHGVRVIQETAAYGAFATGGIRVPPLSFKEIVNRRTGKVLWRASQDPVLRAERVRVAPAADTYLVTNILSDDVARTIEFGYNSPLQLDRPAAAKTGTTESFTDNWTVGYTPQIVTGVWVGNAEGNDPMATGVNGITGAAPIWHTFMENAFQMLHLPVQNFIQPPGVSTGTQCRQSNVSYLSYGNFINGSDLFDANTIPYCRVPTVAGLDDQPSTNYQYVAPAAPSPTAVPTQPAPQLLP